MTGRDRVETRVVSSSTFLQSRKHRLAKNLHFVDTMTCILALPLLRILQRLCLLVVVAADVVFAVVVAVAVAVDVDDVVDDIVAAESVVLFEAAAVVVAVVKAAVVVEKWHYNILSNIYVKPEQ